MKTAIVYEAKREGYAIDQVSDPITVGEMIDLLNDIARHYGDDTLFILSHDNGYTFGSIDRHDASRWEQSDDQEEFEECW